MTTTWNLQEARELIEKLYGKEQLALAKPSFNSVLERRDHANIHWHNTRNLLNWFKRQASKQPLFTIALSDDRKVTGRYFLNETKAGAYVIALIQSLHSIPDIYSHALYYALGMDKTAPFKEEWFVNANGVADKMNAPDLVELRRLFREMFQGGEFKHLAAISNRSKHKSVVKPSMNEDYRGTRPILNYVFPAFTLKGEKYEEVPVREFTEREYYRMSCLIVDIGNELNNVLRGRLGSSTKL